MTTTLYRQTEGFPPDDDSYKCVFDRRIERGQKPHTHPRLNQQSRGLSVIFGLKHARAHARENKHLGNILVRYRIPDGVDFHVEDYGGNDSPHQTLTITPLTALSEYLDMDWWEVQDFNTETAG